MKYRTNDLEIIDRALRMIEASNDYVCLYLDNYDLEEEYAVFCRGKDSDSVFWVRSMVNDLGEEYDFKDQSLTHFIRVNMLLAFKEYKLNKLRE